MILDRFEYIDSYKGINKNLNAAIEYLKNLEYDKIPVGRYVIDSDNIYALVQEYVTKPIEQGKWEAHRTYFDIHFIVSGREMIGYSDSLELTPTGSYDEEKDKTNFSGEGQFHTLFAGMFGIYFPQDAHMPSVFNECVSVKKVVIKVKSKSQQ